MLEARGLTRKYGDLTAVDDVSFRLDEGEIVGMLGPNGAGKTTTLRMLTGYLPPTAGEVTVAGHDLDDEPLQARAELGYLPENVALYTEMRVDEYLAYRARLQGVPRGEREAAIDEVTERCLIGDVRRQIIGTLSKGYRQRVGLATAILHRPRVLILDEPTVGLDPKQIIATRELVRELGRERTLLISTHILPEVELLCDRVLIIDEGRIVDQGSPAGLQRRWRGAPVVSVILKGDPPEAENALVALPGVSRVRRDSGTPGRWLVEAGHDVDLREPLYWLAVEREWVLLELAEERASLEDVFVRLTTRDVEAPSAPSDEKEETEENAEIDERTPVEPQSPEEEMPA